MNNSFHPVNVDDLIEQVWTSLWESTIQGIDAELWPYIEKLNALQPDQYKDSSVNHLYNWMTNINRTSEEFNYVLGPLVHSLYNKRASYVEHNLEINNVCPLFLGLLSAEALALRRPVLLGLWENVAWFFVNFVRDFEYRINEDDYISDQLNEWIICMMTDTDLCPNPYLRLELLDTFSKIAILNDENEEKAFLSIMITCSTVTQEPLKDFLCIELNCCKFLWTISTVWCRLSDQCMSFDNLDKELSKIMLTNVIYNAHNLYATESGLKKWSYELKFLRFLFKTMSEFSHQLYKTFHQNLFSSFGDLLKILDDFYPICSITKSILLNFRRTCQSTSLVDSTASCLMDILEFSVLINITLVNNQNKVHCTTLWEACEVLDLTCENYNGDTLILPIGRTLIHKYDVRFSKLRQQLGQLSSEKLAMIGLDNYCSIIEFLYHCYYYT